MSAIARNRMKNWETIADNLSKAGWSYGYVSALDREGQTIWIADRHRGDGKRFVVVRMELTAPNCLTVVASVCAANNLSKAGWSWGGVSAVDSAGANALDC
jgi:hypothetical protein